MGLYLNPSDESKEKFLASKGELLSGRVEWSDVPAGRLAVILVNNGPFTAAAVAYKESELKEFQDPLDTCQKKIYSVPVSELKSVCSDWDRFVGSDE